MPSYKIGQVLPKVTTKGETPAPCDYETDTSQVKPRIPSYSIATRRKDSNSEFEQNIMLKKLMSLQILWVQVLMHLTFQEGRATRGHQLVHHIVSVADILPTSIQDFPPQL